MFRLRECDLFLFLSIARKEVASELGISHRAVFPDATLLKVAKLRPQTLKEWLSLLWVTRRKMDQYGSRFATMIPPTCQWCRNRECVEDDLPYCSQECRVKLMDSDWVKTGFGRRTKLNAVGCPF